MKWLEGKDLVERLAYQPAQGLKVGMSARICALSVSRAADCVVKFTLLVGVACFPQPTNTAMETIQKYRCMAGFEIMAYSL